MRNRCPKCGKPRGHCECVDICQRCMEAKCCCGETDVKLLGDDFEDRFEMDEDVAYEFSRQEEERDKFYWHGYNYARKVGKKTKVKCPYGDEVERRSFFRGVSDARYQM